MKLWNLAELPDLPKLKLAVIGHVEWVSFIAVDQLPEAGKIGHSKHYFEEPAGGGAVVAVQLAKLTNQSIDFFTSLGKDQYGEQTILRLKELGLNLNVAWRDEKTRRAISIVDQEGERAITVIGKRLQPCGADDLPWDILDSYDGVFVTATDSEGLYKCRKSPFLAATPRVNLKTIEKASIYLDALIGSGLDPDEKVPKKYFSKPPKLIISTEGSLGGYERSLGRFKAFPITSPIKDAYGCGDSFAAGVTAGLSAGWSVEQAISLGAYCGAKCTDHFGPYSNSLFINKA